MGAVLPVVYGIKESAAHGIDLTNGLIIAAGLLVGWFFVRRQHSRGDAMISRELFRHPRFAAGIGLNALAAFAMMGSAFFTTQYLQSVLGMSTLEAALWSMAPSVAVGAAAPTATAIAQRTGRTRVICAGFVIAAAGFAVLALIDTDSLWLLLGGCAVMSSGIVTVMALVSDLALSTAPPEKASSAASLLETGQEFGGAMGMALLGAVATAVYTADMPGSAPEVARKTLPGAVATGDASLISVGRDAFVHSMQYASVAGAALLLAGAVLTVALLRHGSVAAVREGLTG
jgi:DHA2 family multidrug resistance protein-like MFS transporter